MESSIVLRGAESALHAPPSRAFAPGDSAGAWRTLDAFLSGQSELHFHQSLDWYKCHEDVNSFYWATTRDDQVVAASLVRARRIPGTGLSVYRVERGPVVETPEDLETHLRLLVEELRRDAVFVSVNPYYHGARGEECAGILKRGGWRPVPRVLSNYQATIVLDLSADIEQIRANLRRSLRTQLNRGGRLGIRIREGTDAVAIDTFVRQHDAMAQRRGLAPIPDGVTRCLASASPGGTPSMRLLIAEHEGQQVAGILLACAGNRAVYEWGVTSEEERHRQLPLSHMLHWDAIMWAKSAGYRYYDFGGYWEERGDQDSINRFKTGFSKNVQRFVPEHYYPVRPLLAGALLRLLSLKARVRS